MKVRVFFFTLILMTLSFSQELWVNKKSETPNNELHVNLMPTLLNLTQEQLAYLKRKKELKMCVDSNWMPLEKIEEGIHIGIAADFLYKISRKLDIPFRLIPTKEWKGSLLKIQTKECDILSLAQKTPERQKYLNFTTAYVNAPVVIATKVGVPFMDSFQALKDKRLGIVENYSMQELLKSKYPEINFISVVSIQEGLSLVQQEKIFGFIDNAIVINHEIQRKHIKDISISGQFQEVFHLGIASRNDEPLLNEILEHALLSIDHETRDTIMNKWSNISYKTELDYSMMAQIVFFGFVLVSIFMYWNLQLKEEIKKKEKAQSLLKQSEENFRTLFNIAPIFMNAFDENGKIKLWNKECEHIFGWTFEEISNIKNPIRLFYPNIKEQKRFLEMLSNKENTIFEQWDPQTKNGKTIITMWANVYLSETQVIHIGYDVTKEKNSEWKLKEKTQQLKNATQQLEELNSNLKKKIQHEVEKNAKNQLLLLEKNKLAQMGEMIENIAHQWRQPLSEINSLVLLLDQYLLQKGVQDELVEERLTSIEALTYHMSKTIDNFKSFFSSNKKQQSFFLHTTIHNTLLITKGTHEFNYITIEVEAKERLKCYGYPYELQEVLLILLSNATDALIHNDIKKPFIQIKVTQEDNLYALSVSDNAQGIPSKFLDKIFEPYFTTKYKKQGTGIGLYMAKMITEERLKGKLEVKNTPIGACFTIYFSKGDKNATVKE